MRIAFMGTPDLAGTILTDLANWCGENGHDLVCVYAQPPRAAGRGKKERPSPVQKIAEARGIEVRTPISLKKPEAQQDFAALDLDFAIVAAYGLILPQPILDAPRFGCLNVHGSLLPRWRGAAPIQRAIMAGDDRTGVCIMQMEAGLDTGPVFTRREIAIIPEMTAGELHDLLADGNMSILAEAIQAASNGVAPTPQPEDGVTYAHKIDKAEARIDWSQPTETVDRQIRGLSPFPGAWFEHDGSRIKVLRSRIGDGTGIAGTVIGTPLTIACGTGAVDLTELQKAGKSAMPVADFVRGNTFPVGTQIA